MKSTVKGVKLNSFFHLLYFPEGSSAPFGCLAVKAFCSYQESFTSRLKDISSFSPPKSSISVRFLGHPAWTWSLSMVRRVRAMVKPSASASWGGSGGFCGLLGVFTYLWKQFSSTSTLFTESLMFASKKSIILVRCSFSNLWHWILWWVLSSHDSSIFLLVWLNSWTV